LFFAYLYEDRYRQAGSIVQVMFVATWFAVLSKTVDRALVALGDTRSTAIVTFVGFVASLVGTVIGYHYAGINGFCLGVGFGAIVNHLMLYPAMRSHGLSAFAQDLYFSLVAFLFAAIIYGVQNAPLFGAVGEALAVPVEMLGHWLVLVMFSLAVLWFLLMSGRTLLARPGCNG
jgi:O-antigen/teichoic acid export membrane protein